MAYSISSSKGKGNLRHNHRRNERKLTNVDSAKTSQNVELMKERWDELGIKGKDDYTRANKLLKQIYNEYLNPSIARTNPLKAKSDRFEGDGWKYAHQDSALKSYFDELIVQIGNHDERLDSDKTYYEIYKNYLDSFIKANPRLIVFSATIHFDEPQGTPHMHISYVPVYDKIKDVYELDENGNITYEKTPKGKVTKRPQKKFKRDDNGEIIRNKNGKPQTVKLRGLDTYINGDKAIAQQGLEKLSQGEITQEKTEEIEKWKAMGTEARFTEWHQTEMERMREICKSMGIETKIMGNKYKHKTVYLYKESIRETVLLNQKALNTTRDALIENIEITDAKNRVIEKELEKTPELTLLNEKQEKEALHALDVLDRTLRSAKIARTAAGEQVATIKKSDLEEAKHQLNILKELFDFIRHPVRWLLAKVRKAITKTEPRKKTVQNVMRPQIQKANEEKAQVIRNLRMEYNIMELQYLQEEIAKLHLALEWGDRTPLTELKLKIAESTLAERKEKLHKDALDRAAKNADKETHTR